MGFAKVSKILRFVFLGFVVIYSFVALLYIAILIKPELGTTLGVYNEEITPENFIGVAISNIVTWLVFLAADIVFFVSYARYKASLKREQEGSYKSKLSFKRKIKIACRIIGIIFLAFGLFMSLANGLYGTILMLIGTPFFVISFIIRTRKHVGSKDISRRIEGNKLYVTFKDDNLSSKISVSNKLCKIIQDVFNDGYYQFEMCNSNMDNNEVHLMFSTPLSNTEIKEQYKRREKYYNSRGANAHEMPWYFSEQVTIMYYSQEYNRETYSQKVPIYDDEYEITKKNGVEVSRKKVRSVFSHNEIWTYERSYVEYRFYYTNGSPFVTTKGVQMVLHERREIVVDKSRT